MEKTVSMLKALADETRWKILQLLLQNNYCVRALAKRLGMTEAAISQHLKVLREAGFLEGERCGHFMHYHVRRDRLLQLSADIQQLTEIQRPSDQKGCCPKKPASISERMEEGPHGYASGETTEKALW